MVLCGTFKCVIGYAASLYLVMSPKFSGLASLGISFLDAHKLKVDVLPVGLGFTYFRVLSVRKKVSRMWENTYLTINPPHLPSPSHICWLRSHDVAKRRGDFTLKIILAIPFPSWIRYWFRFIPQT